MLSRQSGLNPQNSHSEVKFFIKTIQWVILSHAGTFLQNQNIGLDCQNFDFLLLYTYQVCNACTKGGVHERVVMTSQPQHPRRSLALHKKVLQYSPPIVQDRSSSHLFLCILSENSSLYSLVAYVGDSHSGRTFNSDLEFFDSDAVYSRCYKQNINLFWRLKKLIYKLDFKVMRLDPYNW